jgi:hypothetical protein
MADTPLRLDVVVDTSGVDAYLAGVRNGVPRAAMRAINRGLEATDTLAGRALAENLGLTQGTIRNRRYGVFALDKATEARLIGYYAVRGARLPLTLFRPYQSAKGVAYNLPGGQGFIPHAFLATMPSGHRGVFIRKHLAPTGKRNRLPIDERKGPSLPTVFVKQWRATIQARAIEATQTELDRQVAFLATKGGAA